MTIFFFQSPLQLKCQNRKTNAPFSASLYALRCREGAGRRKDKAGETMCKTHKLLKRCFDPSLIFDFFPGFWRLWNRNVSQRRERLMQKDRGQKTEPCVSVCVCVWGGVAMKTATRTDRA